MSWPLVKLDSVVEVLSGFAFKSSSFNKNSQGVPIIRIQNVAEENSENDFVYWDESYKEKFLIDDGDILLSLSGNIKLGIWGNGKALLNQRIIKISEKEGLDKVYLFYFLMSAVKIIAALGKEAVISNVSVNDFKTLQIPLPPLEIQKKIAAVLEKTDQLRKDCLQMEQELNSLAQSVFIDMFGDPVTNPKGWGVKPISSLLSQPLQNGAYYPKEYYCDDGVEMVHMGDVFYDFIPRGGMKRVNASIKDIEKYRLTSNDLLISRRSLMLEGAAKPSLIEASNEDLIFESSMIRLTPDNEILNVMYLFYYLSNPTVKQHYIFQYITGATIKGINQSNLEKVEVLVPDLKVQKEFLIIEKKIRKQKSELSKLVKEYEANFNSLMQKAFKGELNL